MMLTGLVVSFLFKTYSAGAAALPLRGPTIAEDSGACDFVHGHPTSVNCQLSRTVFDILWSCLATICACTWLSVHPNVPFKNEGRWSIWRRRLLLMLFAILAPEIMVMWAFKQWRGAAMITKAINDACPGM